VPIKHTKQQHVLPAQPLLHTPGILQAHVTPHVQGEVNCEGRCC
jgi:hypothetical protein